VAKSIWYYLSLQFVTDWVRKLRLQLGLFTGGSLIVAALALIIVLQHVVSDNDGSHRRVEDVQVGVRIDRNPDSSVHDQPDHRVTDDGSTD
jgi:hypothetical protein